MRSFVPFACAALAVVTVACEPSRDDASDTNDSANATSPIDRLPVAERPLDRAALLMAAAKAASATALGRVDADQRRLLDGKRFEVRIRFGCPADLRPAGEPAAVRKGAPSRFDVKFGKVDRMLRIRAAPDLNVEDPLIASIGGETVEEVEGFWLRRPWLLADGCPPVPPAPATETQTEDAPAVTESAKPSAAPAAPARTYRVGIAEFFTDADSRAGRRDGRAYETTKVLGGVQQPSDVGYNLVLSGRLRQLPSGQVITCVPASPDEPPQCVISADFDRVRIEAPNTREILAEWSR